MVVLANRASAILYSLVMSLPSDKTFLLPANVCGIVLLVFLKAQRPFELVDISRTDYAVDRQQVLDRVCGDATKYGGLLFVRPYGRCASEDDFFREVKSCCPGCLVIDDRCLAAPAFPASLGQADVLLFSTGSSKYAGMPFGGYAFIEDRIRYVPAKQPYSPIALDSIQSKLKHSVGQQLPFSYDDSDWLDTGAPGLQFSEFRRLVESRTTQVRAHKAALNAIYESNLPEEIQLPPDYHDWRFNIMVRDKEALIEKIFAARLFASSHYASLAAVLRQPRAPVADALHAKVINLFNDEHFTPDLAWQIVSIVKKHVSVQLT